MQHLSAIALGANLHSPHGDPEATIRWALAKLDAHLRVHGLTASAIIETAPVGPPGQPAYRNAAATCATELTPEELMVLLLETEKAASRDRDATERWGPRTLDLDLILYADRVIDSPKLTVPHPRMTERRFVLEPLAEIAPDWIIPGAGFSVAEALARLNQTQHDPATPVS